MSIPVMVILFLVLKFGGNMDVGSALAKTLLISVIVFVVQLVLASGLLAAWFMASSLPGAGPLGAP